MRYSHNYEILFFSQVAETDFHTFMMVGFELSHISAQCLSGHSASRSITHQNLPRDWLVLAPRERLPPGVFATAGERLFRGSY